jgi:hypothetical protein
MTNKEWDNLKIGDKLICRFYHYDAYGKLATLIKISHDNFQKKRINVKWDNIKCLVPIANWELPSSFDLISFEPISNSDILNGGALI